jgi:Na+-transporting NADH:ubiquinone oxidoreductase subunit C
MPDFNPLSLWRRLLSLPNDSKTKTLVMAFAVSVVCAGAVSTLAVQLRPLQEANRLAQQQARLDAAVSQGTGVAGSQADPAAPGLQMLVVDLATGLQATGITPASFDMRAAAVAEETSTALTPEADLARIGRKPKFALIHVQRREGRVERVVLPVWGKGYQSTIHAYLALRGDLKTVASLTIVEHGETPGIGAKIDEPDWQQLWPGKEIADESGEIRLAVAQGTAHSVYEVDGITGATRTGKGLTNMLRFWLGQDGYGAVLDNLRNGRL